MTWIGVAVIVATVAAQTLRMAIPYACAALGGVWSERSGVVNVALEGVLLAGGLAGVVAHRATGSAWIGVVAGVLVGAAIGAFHALVVLRGRVDAIISGLAINLAAAGGTRVVLRAVYGSSSNSPSIRGFHVALLDGASTAALVARTVVDPFALAATILVGWTAWTMRRARFGLRVRACGEDASAAAAAGIDVFRVRLAAVSLGCAIAGLGGVALAYDEHQFQSGMSGGRGFIALAAVILSGWRPVRAAVACLAFAALEALQIVVQNEARAAGSAAQMLPYVATLVALWVVARRGRDRGGAGRSPGELGRTAR